VKMAKYVFRKVTINGFFKNDSLAICAYMPINYGLLNKYDDEAKY